MKKTVKIIGWAFLALLILTIGYGIYSYQTSPIMKALANNDESKLFYRPSSEMKSMEDLEFTENTLNPSDSIKIFTYQFKTTARPKANIFLIRGNSGNVSTAKDLIRPLINNGFQVYTLDWRGYGKSTGEPNYKGIMTDTETAFKDFKEKTKNDSVKTIVYGMSLGGQLAVKLTKDNQDEIDALILDGTLESAHSFLTDNLNGFFMKNLIKDPEEYNQDYIAVRDIATIENIPKLIIHSRIDGAVPFKRGKNIFEAAKEPKEFWETNTEHIKTLTDLPNETVIKLDEIIR